jgi:hypothetical protein
VLKRLRIFLQRLKISWRPVTNTKMPPGGSCVWILQT